MMLIDDLLVRHAEPTDYPPVIAVVDNWWGGRRMADMLPRLFFVHFRETSFVAERDGRIVGFVVGFVSRTFPDEAYIHFVGVDPDCRQGGVAGVLYRRFFEAVGKQGCRTVRCVTSPVNRVSIAFHLRMGFSLGEGDWRMDGIPVMQAYDGPGEDRVLLAKPLQEAGSR